MNSTILTSIPISGSVEEVHFDARGECTWVEFERKDKRWVGVFGKGSIVPDINQAIQFTQSNHVFVLAGGQGYIVDSDTQKCTHKSKRDYFQAAISIPNRELVVACDFTNIEFFDSNKALWRSTRIALDGIRLEGATSSELHGAVWQSDGWYTIVFDLDRREIISQEFASAEWNYFDC
jgi:hypothetical protein